MTDEHTAFFPKPSYYPNQREAMDRVYNALIAGKLVLFEGACGTGKTLSALAPALAVGRKLNKKVFIATNVHQQMEQFVEEAREILGIADVKVIVVKGKSHICPMEKDYEECSALRENTYEMIKAEAELSDLMAQERDAVVNIQKDMSYADVRQGLLKEIKAEEERIAGLRKRSCSYLREVLTRENENFGKWLFSGVRTPEEITAEGMKYGQCGYELIKRNMKYAELVICNYHHLLDPDIARQFLGWADCDLSSAILIFDEAHNLEQQARSHSSTTLSEFTIEKAIGEAATLLKNPRKDEIEYFLQLLKKTLKEAYGSKFGFGETGRIGHAWIDVTIRDPQRGEDLLRQNLLRGLTEKGIVVKKLLEDAIDQGLEIDDRFRKEFKEGRSETRRTSSLLGVVSFMLAYIDRSESIDYYPLINVRRSTEGDIYGRIELFCCIPTDITRPLLNGAFGGVLMSATLRPFDMVKTTLGVDRETTEVSFGTTFPPERRRTLAVDLIPQFAKNRNEPGAVNTLVTLLQNVIRSSEGNVLIFFPSSGEARKYAALIDTEEDVPVLVDEAGTTTQDAKLEFFRHGEEGKKAVLMAYLWGTLTEGVDYKYDRCRTVVIVGVGFPSLNDRTKAIQRAYDERFGVGKGWDYGVLYPTVRRIRQACGRVVRSPADYGVRILADARFTHASVITMKRYSIHMQFPEDERREFVDVKVDKANYSMMNFFRDVTKLDLNEPLIR
ncbi:MAG TPA: ATP-dependent DNA helicase [Methanocella sp.]|nr:ATP-dependent DNA helicase [Methanocella sp.]